MVLAAVIVPLVAAVVLIAPSAWYASGVALSVANKGSKWRAWGNVVVTHAGMVADARHAAQR